MADNNLSTNSDSMNVDSGYNSMNLDEIDQQIPNILSKWSFNEEQNIIKKGDLKNANGSHKKTFRLSYSRDNLRFLVNIDTQKFPNLFLFDIITKNNEEKSIFKNLLLSKFENRFIILQFHQRNQREVFFKDETSSDFINLNTSNSGFGLFFKGLIVNEENSLIESYKRALINRNPFALKFLSIFDENSRDFQTFLIEAIKSVENLLDFETFQLLFDNNNISKMWYLSKATDNNSILMTIVLENKGFILRSLPPSFVDFLTDLPFEHQVKITTTAFDRGFYEIFVDLIRVLDFPFPLGFSEDQITSDVVKSVVKEREDFHDFIRRGNLENVKEFIEIYPSMKYGYNLSNKTSLLKAIDYKEYNVYSFLLSSGFCSRNDPEINSKILQLIASCDLEMEIVDENFKNALLVDNYFIYFLFAKCKIFGKMTPAVKKQRENIIKKCLFNLNLVEQLKPILEISAKEKQLEIVFDFDKIHVGRVATSSGVFTSIGLCIENRYVIVGAKDMSEMKISQTIIHELSHAVMGIVFENDCNPWFKNKVDIKTRFEVIVNQYKHWDYEVFEDGSDDTTDDEDQMEGIEEGIDDECDGIISNVYKRYASSNEQSQELIVRIPEILAAFRENPAIIDDLKITYGSLFTFFDEILEEIKSEKEKLKIRRKVRKLNGNLGLLEQLLDQSNTNTKLKLKNDQITPYDLADDHSILVSNVPILSLINYIQSSSNPQLFNAQNLLIEQDSFNIHSLNHDYRWILNQSSEIISVVECSMSLNPDSIKKIVEAIGGKKLFITNPENYDQLSQILSENEIAPFCLPNDNFTWNQLTSRTQKYLLSSTIQYQNVETSLCSIFNNVDPLNISDEVLNNFSAIVDEALLLKLCSNHEIQINQDHLPDYTENIKFKHHNQLFRARKFNEIVKNREVKVMTAEELSNYKRQHGRPLEVAQDNEKFNVTVETIKYEESSFLQFFIKSQGKKFVILSDIAGSGKSWMLTKIAEHLKEQFPNYWIFFIQLSDFISKFEKLQNQNIDEISFMEIIKNHFMPSKSATEKRFFEQFFNEGKVFLFMDGFDEICPKNKEIGLKVLSKFNESTLNQVFITIRTHLENDFTSVLNEIIFFNFKRWNMEEMKETVRAYLTIDGLSCAEDTPKKIVKKLTLTENTIGVPQLLKFLVDLFKNDMTIIDKKVNIFNLFLKLINLMMTKWSNHGGAYRTNESSSANTSNVSTLRVHQYFGMKVYFNPETFCDLTSDFKRNWSIEKITGSGILTYHPTADLYRFNHANFPEFFSGTFIVNCLQPIIWKNFEDFFGFFVNFMVGIDYSVVRSMIDQGISENEIVFGVDDINNFKEKLINELGRTVDDRFFPETLNLIEYKIARIFYNISFDKLPALLKFFLKLFENEDDQESLKKILNYEPSYSRENVFKYNICMNSLHNSLGRTECFDIFLNLIAKLTTKDEFEKDFLSMHRPSASIFFSALNSKVDPKIISIIIETLSNKHGIESVKILLKTRDFVGKTIFDAFCCLEPFKIKNLTIQWETRSIINKLEVLWDSALKFLSNPELVELITSTANYNKTNIIHKCVMQSNMEILEFIWTKINNLMGGNQKLIAMILEKGLNGKERNALHLSAFNRIVVFPSEFLTFLSNKLGPRALLGLIKSKDKNKNTFLHILMFHRHKRAVEKVFSEIERLFPNNFIDILKLKGYKARNLLQKTVERTFKSTETRIFVWNYLKNALSPSDFLQLIIDSDETDFNTFCIAISQNNLEALNFIENFLVLNFNHEIPSLLSHNIEHNGNDRNLLQFAAMLCESLEIHEYLWEMIERHANVEDFYHETYRGSHLLHLAVHFNNLTIARFTWKKIEQHLGNISSKRNYLSRSGFRGLDLLDNARGSEVIDWVEDLLGQYGVGRF